jgi:hypothetical protein
LLWCKCHSQRLSGKRVAESCCSRLPSASWFVPWCRIAAEVVAKFSTGLHSVTPSHPISFDRIVIVRGRDFRNGREQCEGQLCGMDAEHAEGNMSTADQPCFNSPLIDFWRHVPFQLPFSSSVKLNSTGCPFIPIACPTRPPLLGLSVPSAPDRSRAGSCDCRFMKRLGQSTMRRKS